MKSFLIPLAALTGFVSGQGSPLPVASLDRSSPVSFAKEVVPFLKKNCFACHNENKAKADLNLESPQAMIAGGDSGPSLVPGKPLESLVFTYSAHLEDDPMPPAKNKSKAENLAPGELALLKLWIEQGGVGDSAGDLAGPSSWNDLFKDQAIFASAISPDGRFAAVGRGNRLQLYDLHLGTLEEELIDPDLEATTAHRDAIHSLAFNRNGVLASGGFRSAKIWSRKSGLPTPIGKPLSEPSEILTISPNGAWLVTGDSQGSLTLHPLGDTPAPKLSKQHQKSVRAAVFSKDGSTLYSISDDQILLQARLAEPLGMKKIEGLPQATSLALLDHGKRLALGGADGIVRILPVTVFDDSGESSPLELRGHQARITALVSANLAGSQLLSASEDGTLTFWDLSGNSLRQINNGSPVVALATHLPNSRLATAGADGVVRVWDMATGNKLAELAGDHELETSRVFARQRVEVAKRVKDLRMKALQASEKEWQRLLEHSKKQAEVYSTALKEFDAKENELRNARRTAELIRDEVVQMEQSGQPSLLKASKERAKKADETFKKVEGEWSAARRKKIAAENNRDLAIRDGTRAAERFLSLQTASLEAGNQLASTEEFLKTLEDQAKTLGPGLISNLSISSDGTTVAASTEKLGVQLWSLATFKPLDVLQRGRYAKGVCFHPNGEVIAAFSDRSVVRFPKPAWSKIREIGDGSNADLLPGRVLALDFHPRGSLLATGSGIPSRSGELKVWNIHTGNLDTEIPDTHRDTITGISFSPDGSAIATSSTDRLVKIHDLDSGTLIHKLEGHTHHVLDVAWSADGETIASAGADKLIKQWSIESGRQTKSEGGSRKEFTAVEFLGSGNTLLTSSGENSVRIANQNLGGVTGFVYTATASDDGQLIAAGGEDGILRIWNANDRKLLMTFPPPDDQSGQSGSR